MTTARAWETVLHHVEARLLSGDLAPGDHLPPERTLAVDLGVGRLLVAGPVTLVRGQRRALPPARSR